MHEIPTDRSQELIPTPNVPQRFLEQAALYEDFLRTINVVGWRLIEVSKNFRKGASVYGFFRYEGGVQNP